MCTLEFKEIFSWWLRRSFVLWDFSLKGRWAATHTQNEVRPQLTNTDIEMQILDVALLRINNDCSGVGDFIQMLNPTSNLIELGQRVQLGVSTKFTFQVWPLEQN